MPVTPGGDKKGPTEKEKKAVETAARKKAQADKKDKKK
jgi:hypothetical protein